MSCEYTCQVSFLRICFSLNILLEASLLGKDLDMGGQSEKRPELDPPYSKRSRDGVHTVLYDLTANFVVDSKDSCDTQGFC